MKIQGKQYRVSTEPDVTANLRGAVVTVTVAHQHHVVCEDGHGRLWWITNDRLEEVPDGETKLATSGTGVVERQEGPR